MRLQCADLYVVKGRHKIGSDLCHFLFGYGIGGILITGLENVFQRAAVLGRASTDIAEAASKKGDQTLRRSA